LYLDWFRDWYAASCTQQPMQTTLTCLSLLLFVDTSYEAYVLYEFFVLLTQFCDGEDNLIDILVDKPDLPHPWPLCCLPPFAMGRYIILAIHLAL
jgi:hypothetical protein